MDPVTVNGRDDLFLLDVREPQEWRAGHVDGSTHIPMGHLGVRQEELPADQPIVCICRSGQRSATVTSALAGAGYEAHNLEGGLLAWVEARLPLVTDEGEAGTVV
jgi:rhodanese-related sulfurtransferase